MGKITKKKKPKKNIIVRRESSRINYVERQRMGYIREGIYIMYG